MTPSPTDLTQLATLQAENERLQRLVGQQKETIEDNTFRLEEQQHSITLKDQKIGQQKQEIEKKKQEIEKKEQEIDYLQERLAILLSKRYKAQSEQLSHLQGQLFDESELEAAITETQRAIDALEASKSPGSEDATENLTQPKQKTKPKRKKLPDHLRRVEVIIDVSEEDKQAMGDDWVCIGYDDAEKLAVQQREYYVKVLKRKKYVRKTDQHNDNTALSCVSAGIKVASPAKVILPRAIADASLLADVLCSKFIDAMSFYRTNTRLQREGIDIGYSTLCDWPLQLYERLTPFETLFYEAIGQSDLWHLDETTLQVLDEPGRDNHTKSYLWGIRAVSSGGVVVLFHYHPRRNYDALEQWLRPCLDDFRGVIVTDEHRPYDILSSQHTNIQAHGGCLAHCRRKFADACKGRRHGSDAHKVLQKIAMIYTQENRLAKLDGDELKHARLEHIKPLMESLKTYLTKLAPCYLNKGAMKTAIGYALNNWAKFTAFLDHPSLPIDNNLMERSIRPFTLGRKNFLFSGSPRGASASAFIYSLVESAKANGLEPKSYLEALFESYPHAQTDDERRTLLPWNFKFSR